MYWRGLALTLLAMLAEGQGQDTVIRSSVREVVLDFTVRNKSEKLVRDLRAEEVDVFVDGVKQNVRSFRLVTGAETRKIEQAEPLRDRGAKQVDKLPPPNSAREINLVALVFRTGGSEQRSRAQKAALEFISGELRPHTYIAVLSVSKMTTRVAQSFTSNQTLLADAINRTLSSSGTKEVSPELAALMPPGPPPTTPVRGPGDTPGKLDSNNAATSKLDASVGTGLGDSLLRQIELDSGPTDANTNALFEMDQMRAILNQMAGMPGRKTVIAMINSLATPPEQQEVFENLIRDSKRRGITFYGVALSGLTPSTSISAASSSIASAAATSQTQGMTPAVSRAQARNEDQILFGTRSADAENSLRVLAESTGGFLISNTNDIAHQMPRIMDEVNTHYELAWTPADTTFNGKFRKIEVKLKRAGLHVQCREGYYALPDLGGHQFQSFELTGLRTLDTRPLPADFEFRASALRFSPGGVDWQGVMAFEAPIDKFASIDPTANAGKMQVHGTVVAVIKDTAGEIVRIVSDNVSYEVPQAKSSEFLAGNLTITLPVRLDPGRWTIEATMSSPGNETASAKRISVFVPQPVRPSISTISLARRIEPRVESDTILGPFDIGRSRVTPTLTSDVPDGAEPRLYFVVYPSPNIATKPEVLVQYFREGKEIGRDSPAIRSDWSEAIPLLAGVQLAPGEYEVRVTATQGNRAARETSWIRVNSPPR